jgi:CYTH domain-containing protein
MGAAIPTSESTVVVESKYARVERERRLILREMPLPLTRASEHVQIWDNYITGTRLRLRKIRTPQTRKWTMKLTQKFAPAPPDFSRTIITNTYLSAYEYQVLSVFEGNEIRKNRYPFEYEGRRYSIDVFLGALWGLILAETDFETDEEMDGFTTPPFAVMDVTNEEMFTGGRLVDLTTDELRVELQRLLEKHQG